MERLIPANYPILLPALKEAEINTLFARAVIEGRVDGVVHVDRLIKPRVIYVKHPYGMSLVLGDREAFGNWEPFWSHIVSYSGKEAKDEWLQVWPDSSATEFEERRKRLSDNEPESFEAVENHIRVNFQFNRMEFDRLPDTCPEQVAASIIRTGPDEYDALQGSVLPRYFWKGRDTFLKEGVGFSLVCGGVVASTAFSAFIHDQKLELGIETREEFQGRGYAFAVCRRLIRYCLDKGYEPVWSCRLGNSGSVKLAHKLGFQTSLHLPYFRIKGCESRARHVCGSDPAR